MRVVAALLLAACGDPVAHGFAASCLTHDDSAGDTGSPERSLVEITGAVTHADRVDGCPPQVDRFLAITDADGVVRTLGYGMTDPGGASVTPELDLTDGEEVTLRHRAIHSFGDASGFVLTDADGLVAAFEAGTWGAALEPADLPGFTVASGEPVAAERRDCGHFRQRALVFEADASTTVAPFGSAGLELGGVPYTAMAIANTAWVESRCPDLAGHTIWALVR